jgi:hypothetical protein
LRLEKHWQTHIQQGSRIGVQRILTSDARAVQDLKSTSNSNRVANSNFGGNSSSHRLRMIVGADGYFGSCYTDGGLINVAGAIDPVAIRDRGSIDAVFSNLLRGADAVDEQFDERHAWSSTPPLTRRTFPLAHDRALLLGDAMGYVEPFTGEGMSWALASAESVMTIVKSSIQFGWQPALAQQWSDSLVRGRARKQWICRWLAGQLRRPRLAAWVMRACDLLVPLRSTLVKEVCS